MGGGAWGAETPPLQNFTMCNLGNFYRSCNCILYICMSNKKMEREGRMANLHLELLRGDQIIFLM